ncbi:MAG: hypothetical protein JKY88_06345 [Pseudomonadales bacterium]|nr:hypothetical protein [Pseudomonadales bacterium]
MGNIVIQLMPLFIIFIIGQVVVNIIRASKSGVKTKVIQEKFAAFEDDLALLEQDLDDTRQRIEVLEKIATDEKRDLNRKIDGLGNV